MANSHNHTSSDYGQAFAIGVTLNLAFVIVEFIYGNLSNSLALVADAGPNLSDVLGLSLAWGRRCLVVILRRAEPMECGALRFLPLSSMP